MIPATRCAPHPGWFSHDYSTALPAPLRQKKASGLALERHHEHIAMRGLGVVDRLDRRYAVEHARIIDQRGIERALECEAAEQAPIGSRVDFRGAARDIDAIDHQYEYVIDTVTMHALGSRLTGLVRSRLDAELMHFDAPSVRVRRERTESISAKVQNGTQRRARADGGIDRFEPAFDAALQRVVFKTLVMRLMRLPYDRVVMSTISAHDSEHRMAPAPIAAVVGKVAVEREIVPARGKCGPVTQPPERLQTGARLRPGHETKSVARHPDVSRFLQALRISAHASTLPGMPYSRQSRLA